MLLVQKSSGKYPIPVLVSSLRIGVLADSFDTRVFTTTLCCLKASETARRSAIYLARGLVVWVCHETIRRRIVLNRTLWRVRHAEGRSVQWPGGLCTMNIDVGVRYMKYETRWN